MANFLGNRFSGLFGSETSFEAAEKTNLANIYSDEIVIRKLRVALQEGEKRATAAAITESLTPRDAEKRKFREQWEVIVHEFGGEKGRLTKSCLDTLSDRQQIRIFMTLRDIGAFGSMRNMFEESNNLGFTQNRAVMEAIAAICSHDTDYIDANYETTLALYKMLDAHEDSGNISFSGEAHRAKARAHYGLYQVARALLNTLPDHTDRKNAEANYRRYFPYVRDDDEIRRIKSTAMHHLNAARETYREAFLKNMEVASGVGLVHRELYNFQPERGESGEKGFERAVQTAKIVYKACVRDGGIQSKDPWCLLNLLEMTCLTDRPEQEISVLVERLAKLHPPKWQIANVADTMNKVLETIKRLNTHPEVLAKFAEANEALEQIMAGKIPEKPAKSLDERTRIFYKRTSSYRGILGSTYTHAYEINQGNVMKDGQTLGHLVNHEDIRQFAEIRNTPLTELLDKNHLQRLPRAVAEMIRSDPRTTINDIDPKGPDDVLNVMMLLSQTVDVLVRQTFRTDELQLENIASQGHKLYDTAVRGLVKLTGIPEYKKQILAQNPDTADRRLMDVDTATSLSVLVALGLGDCRQHAHMKQLICDGWQRDKINKQLSIMYEHRSEESDESYRRAQEMCSAMERIQIRTAAQALNIPVLTEKDEIYSKPVLKDGEFVCDPSRKSIFDKHVFNVLVETGADGALKNVYKADAFYQRGGVFNFGDLSEIKVTNDAKEQLVMDLGTMRVMNIPFTRDPEGTVKFTADEGSVSEIPVTTISLSHAGDKTNKLKPTSTDPVLVGRPIIKDGFRLTDYIKGNALADKAKLHEKLARFIEPELVIQNSPLAAGDSDYIPQRGNERGCL